MTLFRCPSRLLFLTAFFGITLAGIGLHEVMESMRKNLRLRAYIPSLALVILFLMSAEGAFFARRYLTTAPHEQVLPLTEYRKFFASDPAVYRIAPFGRHTVNYGWASRMGLEMITGYDSFNLAHYRDFLAMLRQGRLPSPRAAVWADLDRVARLDFLDALNVKYLLFPGEIRPSPERFEKVAYWSDQPLFEFYGGMRRGDIHAYRNKSFQERAYWVRHVHEVESQSRMAAKMLDMKLSDSAVILGNKTGQRDLGEPGEDKARIDRQSEGLTSVLTNIRKERFLVLSEVWHPGWRAEINGKESPIYQTNLALMGLWVPPGDHHIVFRFRPLYWSFSLIITAVGCLMFLALMVKTLHKGRAQKPALKALPAHSELKSRKPA